MIVIDHTIISDDIAEEYFVCDLLRCKGACCVEGTGGAPLKEEELTILRELYEDIEPYLTEKGKAVIKKYGAYVRDSDGDWTTPVIEGRECAYAYYDEHKILKCGIERAWKEGKVNFRKPVSCHLYPIRISKYEHYEALNYHHWHICSPACRNGDTLQVPLYRFLKESLIRKYGEVWYQKLEEAIEEKNSQTDL